MFSKQTFTCEFNCRIGLDDCSSSPSSEPYVYVTIHTAQANLYLSKTNRNLLYDLQSNLSYHGHKDCNHVLS